MTGYSAMLVIRKIQIRIIISLCGLPCFICCIRLENFLIQGISSASKNAGNNAGQRGNQDGHLENDLAGFSETMHCGKEGPMRTMEK
jgi:hypothetical protein